MKILITGAKGQLGWELQKVLSKHQLFLADKDNFDITKAQLVLGKTKVFNPAVIVHTAAYTAVDEAERHPHRAFLVNSKGTENVARAAKAVGARLIAISTDYVFAGRRQHRPYTEKDRPNPKSIYGKSKLAGEKAAQKFGPPETFILRTAWLYGEHGENFVKTILTLLQKKQEIKVVADQIGSPTWANELARAIAAFIRQKTAKPGIYHVSGLGPASWYDFARVIRDQANLKTKIVPCRTQEFPRPAPRPAYCYLSKAKLHRSGIFKMRPWPESYAQFWRLAKNKLR